LTLRVELRLSDGADAGIFETAVPDWNVGETFVARGNRRFRIRAIIAVERLERSVNRPLYGLFEVEPI
jgi:hypothetical protein